MSWASRRKALYTTGTLLFFLVPLSIVSFIWWYEAPHCFDGILNGLETAVDKGGNCELLDERTLIPHSVLWARPFMVRPGLFNAVAYIENPNQEAGVERVGYRMRLYDVDNVLVAERVGETYIMPGAITPVFEGSIDTGARVAVRAFFEFNESLTWYRMEGLTSTLIIDNKQLTDIDTVPRLSARIVNTEPYNRRNIEVVAVALDGAGNAFATSQTILPRLDGKEQLTVTFTWPLPFEREPARIDVLARIAPLR